MLKQSLQQKLGLKINPLQIQLIKLLELPTYQLEQRIKEELEQNPLLEEVEEKGETDVNEETATDSGEEFEDDYQEDEPDVIDVVDEIEQTEQIDGNEANKHVEREDPQGVPTTQH